MVRDAIEGFLVARRNTEASKRVGRTVLLRFAAETGWKHPVSLIGDDVLSWWAAVAPTAAPASRRAYYSTVCAFLRWADSPVDLERLVRRPVVRAKPPVTLTLAEVDAIRHQCRTMRDRVVIELAYGLGLRVMEIAALQVEDIDWRRMLVEVNGKGGSIDVLPLPQRVAWAIKAYYLQAPPPGSGPVVRRLYSSLPMTADTLSKLVIKLSKAAGVKRAPYDGRGAHSLRRTCATDLLESGASVVQVQQVLRHQNLATTQAYLRRSSAEELRGVLERRATA